MKAVTANRLADGTVVYLDVDGQWTPDIAAARRLTAAETEPTLAAARARSEDIASAYLIEVSDGGAPSGRETLRETIRSLGPTVRRDLGRQAEAR
jgi:hypothetical protein